MEDKNPEYPGPDEEFISETAEQVLDSILYDSNLYVVGVGGCGCNSVEYITGQEMDSVKTIAINTDERVLDDLEADKQMLIGKELTDGKGANGDIDVGRRAAEQSEEQILRAIDDADIVVLAAGVGGGTGGGASQVIADLARRNGKMVVTYAVMPFTAEKTRYNVAEDVLGDISQQSHATTVFENDETLVRSDEKPEDAFGIADRMLHRLVKKLRMSYVREFFEEIGLDAMGLSETVTEFDEEQEKERPQEEPAVLEALKYVSEEEGEEQEEPMLDNTLESYTP